MMRHNQIVELISTTVSPDEIGNQLERPDHRKVYANEFSVGYADFSNAALSGLRPEKIFEVYTFEYRGEERLLHGSMTYRIVRVDGRGDKTRLMCERVAADG